MNHRDTPYYLYSPYTVLLKQPDKRNGIRINLQTQVNMVAYVYSRVLNLCNFIAYVSDNVMNMRSGCGS